VSTNVWGRQQGDKIVRIFAQRAIAYFRQFHKNYRGGPIFWDSFFRSIAYVLILTKIGWATFWGVFLQTHLVALAESQVLIATSPQNKNLVIRSLCLACCHEWQTQP
jgi:hypothetical protein